ncbi:hypothetical protein XJ32_02855 [Helicobacter bilis]|uniref:Uncharacterized protein n=1 Tax=Helicobacter bilis TaxID=37372 RepID=A0A1Q2LFN2_9HELI|nr:hypothetical protein [Helicobacter bilis]AQQ59215.1 hypothetical protein XJ32_02855 [Helicobacter bilis]
MKKEKFDCSKFILDCFVCVALMIVSIAIFIKPLYYLYGFFIRNGLNIIGYDGFYFIALQFNILSLVPFAIIYFLYKKNKLQYRIYKSSFWFVFISINSYWWLAAYHLANGGFSK